MTVSDSLPIQFWPVASETFNENEICSVTAPKCYCMPIKSDQAFTLRVTADSTPQLRIYDDSDTLLFSQNFNNVSGDVYQIGVTLSSSIGETFNKDQKIRMSIFEASVEVYKSDCITLFNCGGYTYEILLQNNSNTTGAIWFASFNDDSLQAEAPGSDGEVIEMTSSLSVSCDVQKLSNSGIAQGAGSIIFTRNLTPENTINFIDMEDVSSNSYIFTDVQPGDDLAVIITGDGIPE